MPIKAFGISNINDFCTQFQGLVAPCMIANHKGNLKVMRRILRADKNSFLSLITANFATVLAKALAHSSTKWLTNYLGEQQFDILLEQHIASVLYNLFLWTANPNDSVMVLRQIMGDVDEAEEQLTLNGHYPVNIVLKSAEKLAELLDRGSAEQLFTPPVLHFLFQHLFEDIQSTHCQDEKRRLFRVVCLIVSIGQQNISGGFNIRMLMYRAVQLAESSDDIKSICGLLRFSGHIALSGNLSDGKYFFTRIIPKMITTAITHQYTPIFLPLLQTAKELVTAGMAYEDKASACYAEDAADLLELAEAGSYKKAMLATGDWRQKNIATQLKLKEGIHGLLVNQFARYFGSRLTHPSVSEQAQIYYKLLGDCHSQDFGINFLAQFCQHYTCTTQLFAELPPAHLPALNYNEAIPAAVQCGIGIVSSLLLDGDTTIGNSASKLLSLMLATTEGADLLATLEDEEQELLSVFNTAEAATARAEPSLTLPLDKRALEYNGGQYEDWLFNATNAIIMALNRPFFKHVGDALAHRPSLSILLLPELIQLILNQHHNTHSCNHRNSSCPQVAISAMFNQLSFHEAISDNKGAVIDVILLLASQLCQQYGPINYTRLPTINQLQLARTALVRGLPYTARLFVDILQLLRGTDYSLSPVERDEELALMGAISEKIVHPKD
jgi:hypothetical protein